MIEGGTGGPDNLSLETSHRATNVYGEWVKVGPSPARAHQWVHCELASEAHDCELRSQMRTLLLVKGELGQARRLASLMPN
jgi:hypothetical protein